MESSVKEEKHEPGEVKQEENASIKSEQQQETASTSGEEIKKEEGKDEEVKKELDPLIESFYSEVSVFFLFNSYLKNKDKSLT